MSRPILPSLDLIRGFEAAARHLSFTRAAEELCVTQSAVSRQVKALEDALGVRLFDRLPRALVLTEAGRTLQRTAADVLRQVDDTARKLQASLRALVTVSSTIGFASLWLVPRLAAFRRSRPGIDVRIAADNEVSDLEREGIDVAVRYSPSDRKVGRRLFGEEVFPVCSPRLLNDPAAPLAVPEDLRHHVLLHVDDPAGRWPWIDWREWLAASGVDDFTPAGSLRFSHYDQLINAAIAGQGVALGRNPLTADLLAEGLLAAPFPQRTTPARAYFVITAEGANERPEVAEFVEWLFEEAGVS